MGEVLTTFGMLVVAFGFGWAAHWLRFQRCLMCRTRLPFFRR